LIDLHSHILPGIDDGSRSLEESVALCRIAAADGVRRTVCTPHIDFRFVNRRETIEGPFAALERELREAGVELELVKGAEVHISPDILMTYSDMGRYLLLEFPFQKVLTGVEEMVYRLRLASITPVIAHPERIGYFMDDIEHLHKVISMGALAQITGGSITGQFGDRSQRAALAMVERNLAHVVASDAHDVSYRRPVLAEAREEIARRFGEQRAAQMTQEYPAAIVQGEEIDPDPPLEAAKKKGGFLSRLFAPSRP
jgi:protein-tyrosine phosphatase